MSLTKPAVKPLETNYPNQTVVQTLSKKLTPNKNSYALIF
jgi:hypothetical protein